MRINPQGLSLKTARDLIAVMSGFGIPDAVFSCFPHNHILQVKESERGNVIVACMIYFIGPHLNWERTQSSIGVY